mmetsp:Transcript_36951/g.91956  ORF Transcript_36951/g.91956 Transcript_36951/m.91956 type:complete len:260 (+) Transcript_36951:607-1386(+)
MLRVYVASGRECGGMRTLMRLTASMVHTTMMRLCLRLGHCLQSSCRCRRTPATRWRPEGVGGVGSAVVDVSVLRLDIRIRRTLGGLARAHLLLQVWVGREVPVLLTGSSGRPGHLRERLPILLPVLLLPLSLLYVSLLLDRGSGGRLLLVRHVFGVGIEHDAETASPAGQRWMVKQRRRVWALPEVHGEAQLQNVCHLRRVLPRGKWWVNTPHDFTNKCSLVLGVEGVFAPRAHFVQHHPQRPHVRLFVVWLVLAQLRR